MTNFFLYTLKNRSMSPIFEFDLEFHHMAVVFDLEFEYGNRPDTDYKCGNIVMTNFSFIRLYDLEKKIKVTHL